MIYDVDGNRIARVDANGEATAFIAGHELLITSGEVVATRYYEHAGDVIASRSSSDATGNKDTIWLGSDQHGSVNWALNSVTRVETIKYADPYANERGGSVTWTAGQKGFVGGVEDPTGLTLLGARYYDPMLGAFISVDPEIDECDPQRLHAYAYANNNPVTFADPDGLFFGKIKNAASKAVGTVANAAKATASFVVENAGTISAVAGGIAMVTAVLPPPAQVVAAAAGAVAAVAGAIDTAKTCAGGDAMGCAMGIAEMVPGVRQAKNAVRGAGAIKAAVKGKAPGAGDLGVDESCVFHSFDPETQVLMADGATRPIEDIAVGDEVMATEPITGKSEAKEVTHLHRHVDTALTDVVVRDQDGVEATIETTQHHPFWNDSKQLWEDAKDLKPGTELRVHDDSRLEGDSTGAGMGGGGPGVQVTVVDVRNYGGAKEMRDLTVADIHTYHVLAAGAPVLVRNCDVFYRAMSKKEFEQLGPNGEITVKHTENFVTQSRSYLEGLRGRTHHRGGRNSQKYEVLVRCEMEPGTREALIASGKTSDKIGDNRNFVHLKKERETDTYGLRPGSVGVFNSRILRYEKLEW